MELSPQSPSFSLLAAGLRHIAVFVPMNLTRYKDTSARLKLITVPAFVKFQSRIWNLGSASKSLPGPENRAFVCLEMCMCPDGMPAGCNPADSWGPQHPGHTRPEVRKHVTCWRISLQMKCAAVAVNVSMASLEHEVSHHWGRMLWKYFALSNICLSRSYAGDRDSWDSSDQYFFSSANSES